MTEQVQRRGTVAGRRDDVDHDRQHREQRADREAAARRPQHPRLRAARAGRGAERRRRATANTTACPAARSTSRSTASTTTRSASAAAARASSCSRPIRLGAIEEVTVSTAGLTADAGAEGAVQIQFVDQARDERVPRPGVRSDPERQAQRAAARSTRRAAFRRPSCGSTSTAPTSAARSSRNKLFFFAQLRADLRSRARRRRTAPCSRRKRSRASSATAAPTTRCARSTCSTSPRANGLPGDDRSVRRRAAPGRQRRRSARATSSRRNLLQNTFSFINRTAAEHQHLSRPARVDYQASSSLAHPRRAEPALARSADATRISRAADSQRRVHVDVLHPLDRRRLDGHAEPVQSDQLRRPEQLRGVQPGNTLDIYDRKAAGGIELPLSGRRRRSPTTSHADPAQQPGLEHLNTLTWLKGKHTCTFGGTFRRTTMYESIGGAPPTDQPRRRGGRSRLERLHRDDHSGRAQRRSGDGARSLYALLTGRISTRRRHVRPRRGHQASTGWTRRSGGKRRTSAASTRRISGASARQLTLNYGLRWEFSGAATNTERRLQRPDARRPARAVDGAVPAGHAQRCADPQIYPAAEARTTATSSTRRRTSASRGIPTSRTAASASCSGRAVYRANFGVNYYDEGLINFQTGGRQRSGLQPDAGAAARSRRDR